MIEGFFPHPLSLANQGQLKWHTTVIQSLQNDLNRVSNRVRVSTPPINNLVCPKKWGGLGLNGIMLK